MGFYPTFSAAASQKIPKETMIDGVNLLPYLINKSKQPPHDKLFWYHGDHGAVRSGEWKLYLSKNKAKLFNLRKDIAEKNDLSKRFPEVKN